jgi:predicted  nucleic acid-binding Zn-ribbon protein
LDLKNISDLEEEILNLISNKTNISDELVRKANNLLRFVTELDKKNIKFNSKKTTVKEYFNLVKSKVKKYNDNKIELNKLQKRLDKNDNSKQLTPLDYDKEKL